jgi:hypothetical protein
MTAARLCGFVDKIRQLGIVSEVLLRSSASEFYKILNKMRLIIEFAI